MAGDGAGVAAQIATFPLSIFYFHQFPTYFWLVNPLVVTFTNVLLPAALVLLLFSATPLVGLFGKIVSVSAWLTDWSASLPRALPGHLVENLHVNAMEVVMLYAIIFLVWLAVEMRSLVWLKYAAASILLFVAVAMAASLQNYGHSERVTFEIPKHRVMTFKRGNVLWLVSDRAFAKDSRAWDYHIQPYAVSREIQRIVSVTAH